MCAVTVLLSEYIRQGCILYICQLTEHNLSFFSLYKAVILSPFSLSLSHGYPSSFLFVIACSLFQDENRMLNKEEKEVFYFHLHFVSGHLASLLQTAFLLHLRVLLLRL